MSNEITNHNQNHNKMGKILVKDNLAKLITKSHYGQN